MKNLLPDGFPTHSKDITGRTICLGDTVIYDFKGDGKGESFVVIFEDNAFRKKYPKWDKTLAKPLLEYRHLAKSMRLKVISEPYKHTPLIDNAVKKLNKYRLSKKTI